MIVRAIGALRYVVARFVLLEDIRRARRSVRRGGVRGGKASAVAAFNGAASDDHRFDCLDRCLQGLRADERALIVEYYGGARRQGAEHRLRMAERMGISKNALCIRATRIRERLMNCVAHPPGGPA